MIEDSLTRGSDDTLGRVLWGLGTVVQVGPKRADTGPGPKHDGKAAPRIAELEAPRAKAYAIIGMCHLLKKI